MSILDKELLNKDRKSLPEELLNLRMKNVNWITVGE